MTLKISASWPALFRKGIHSGCFFNPQPPSLAILLSEPGSESKVLSEETCFSLLQGGPGSVRFGSGLGVERFERFRFSVPAVLCKKGFSVLQYSLTGKDGFGSWKTVPAVPVPLSVSGKTVPTVPVSGSGSVPEPPCY